MRREKSKRTQVGNYSVLLVCDFQVGLVSRLLDVYRFFGQRPSIVLARRGRNFQTDPRIRMRTEVVPVHVKGLEKADLISELSAACYVIAYLLYALVVYVRIRSRGENIALVHAHFVFPQGLFALFLAVLLRTPFLVTAHGQDVNFLMRRNVILRRMCRLILERAYATIAVSRPLQNRLREFGVPDIVYIPNSVDMSTIVAVDQSKYGDKILFVGNLTENKRPLVLIDAFEKVAKQVPSATLLLCGDGPLREKVQEEISKRGLTERARALGVISPNLLNKIRSEAGLFVLPSASEGLSLALLEAMAAGEAIIVSRNESHLALIENGKSGLLFEIDGPEELAKQISLVIRDQNLRFKLSEYARHLCESEFSNTVVAAKLEALYSQTIRASKVR